MASRAGCYRSACVLALSLIPFVSIRSEASACSRTYPTVEYLLPVTEDVPLNGSMLAYIEAPHPESTEEHISLRTLDGVQIAVEVTLERSPNDATALAHGTPLQPLEPHTTYVWSVVGWEQEFTTGDVIDATPPSFDDVVVSYAGIATWLGCFGQTFKWREYELEITGVDEAVAAYTVLGSFHAAYDASVTVTAPLTPAQDQCYEVFLQDHGGNVVSAGNHCLGLVEDGDGEGDESGEVGGTDETGSIDGTDGEAGGFDSSGNACACRADAAPASGAAVWLLLFGVFALGRARRDSGV